MANTYQQMAQQRKLIYAIAIVSLFTVSLVYRKLVIEPQAFELQLRESARGEVELESSAVRLTLTGSRGLAVTILWSAAIKRQMKHEWNELELLVDSITKLQPYFITPWRFQGWNLAFNVAVECDRPVDKYYYISRGITLLSQGERRNQGAELEPGTTAFPGSPELRRDIGVTYQLKIGNSDEKYTMRCLLDMSCIDPAKWQFVKKALEAGKRFKQDKDLLGKFETFCRENPMLVRRLVDHVSCDTDRKVLLFLEDNKDVPTRFEPLKYEGQERAEPKKDVYEQFPILPRHESDWPDPTKYQLTSEPMSVYLISRTWFQYAQKPLPPPFNYFDESRPDYRKWLADPRKHRSALMADPIFRSDPSRAQAFIAETREEEGWFLGEGWPAPANWFERATLFGTGREFQSPPIWEKTYEMYKTYGTETGMYLTEAHRKKLEAEAQKFRAEYKLTPEMPAKDLGSGKNGPGYYAHETLRQNESNRKMTNFDAHLYQAEARRDVEAVLAKRYFYQADKARLIRPPDAPTLYERGNVIWMGVLFKHPKYAKNSGSQEDTCEIEIEYMRIVQSENSKLFSTLAMRAAEIILQYPYVPIPWSVTWTDKKFLSDEERAGIAKDKKMRNILLGTAEMVPQWPYVPIPWSATWVDLNPKSASQPAKKFLSDAERFKASRISSVRDEFSTTRYYDGPHAEEIKLALLPWLNGASLVPLVNFPDQQYWLLTTRTLGEMRPPPNWRFLVEDDAVRTVRQRHNYPQLGQ